ncbi:MAG: BolA family transcriptional regulator [Alphaproteobacteria bacterium]|nr:BolA family transcriptional regulator [Alphaproteobacteria bacterium]
MIRKKNIETRISKIFQPYFFSVNDVSEQHRGHQSFKENVESHFEVIVVSSKFDNKSKILRHRMINECLQEDFQSDLHSVSIKAFTVEEYKKIN